MNIKSELTIYNAGQVLLASHLDVVLLLFLYFGLTVGGCGQRHVGTVEVVGIFALVGLVLPLALVVVANAEEDDTDDYENRNNQSTCQHRDMSRPCN